MPLESCPPLVQALCCNLDQLNLLIVDINLPSSPETSVLTSNWIKFNNYLNDVEGLQPNHQILLIGDFNTRIGQDNIMLFNAADIVESSSSSSSFPNPRLSLTKWACYYWIFVSQPIN
uniref:Uncharacterized protein n=1 Tax=Sphaerodactylus townsendi TaxID=933632 RepID=A0ACB8FZV4_9SAUR